MFLKKNILSKNIAMEDKFQKKFNTPPVGNTDAVIKSFVRPILSFALVLAIWQLLCSRGVYSPYELPSPAMVLKATGEILKEGLLWKHLCISLFRFVSAYFLAASSGIFLGLALGWSKVLLTYCDPLIQVLRPISPVAWFPLAILWFGVGNAPAIFIIFLAAFFPVLLTAATAVRQINPLFLKVAINFGAQQGQLLWKVVLPASFPQIVVGLRLALGAAWIHLVAGEMLGAQSGLGFFIVDARNFLRTDLIINGMIIIGLLGLTLDKLVAWLEKKVTARWGYAGR